MAKIIREKKPKIIQIIPAQGIVAVYTDEDTGGEFKCPVQVIALDDEGEIELIEFDSSGWADSPATASNFLRYEFGEDQE